MDSQDKADNQLICDHSVYNAADYSFCSYITEQQIYSSLHDLHLHKASSPDNIAGEHLLYAHPSLIIHLKLLFSLIVAHGFMPDASRHHSTVSKIKIII